MTVSDCQEFLLSGKASPVCPSKPVLSHGSPKFFENNTWIGRCCRKAGYSGSVRKSATWPAARAGNPEALRPTFLEHQYSPRDWPDCHADGEQSTALSAVQFSAVHCSAVNCTSLHCTTLHCTALYHTVPHWSALHWITCHFLALHCIAGQWIAFHHTSLHFTVYHCNTLHCTALYITTLHCTALHCFALHWTGQQLAEVFSNKQIPLGQAQCDKPLSNSH